MVRKASGYDGIKTDDLDVETYLGADVMAAHGFWMERYAECRQWLCLWQRMQVSRCLTDFPPGDRTWLAAIHTGDFSTD
ncbi:hypothetical protein LGM57_18675 [Burkholderia cepacia]|uniref:hypothetical protein n=1 Tax=Burkholderia cepacia TaxID=292 RepID=UPI00075F57AD|nr:hypothetical protein [Burkholderia cepacia]KVW77797.1 hypothetical protein WL00_35135 [Burkholderia cepacia]KVX60805.1 hypothetical protein WL07_00995 [Burkholderia cepacia]MCA7978357.1 hypothetical protein [Burkholderia cepacia]